MSVLGDFLPDFCIFPAHGAVFSKHLNERRAGVLSPGPSSSKSSCDNAEGRLSKASTQGRHAGGRPAGLTGACVPARGVCRPCLFSRPSMASREGGGSVGAQLLPPASPSPFRNLSSDSIPY